MLNMICHLLISLSLARHIVAQSFATSLQPTTTTGLPALMTKLLSSPSILDCMASMRCDEQVSFGQFSDTSCKYPTTECQCVAWNSTGYVDCLRDKCPENWQGSFISSHQFKTKSSRDFNFTAMREQKLKVCTEYLQVDLSGNTTYTGIAMPTSSMNATIIGVIAPDEDREDGGLSQSDKIAIGIGVGFGVPTIVVGLGAWLCARRRKGKTITAENDCKSEDEETILS